MLATFLIISLCGCGHEHLYESETTLEATCEAVGTLTYTCECGESYTEEIPPTGHVWDEGATAKEPTCIDEGEKIFTCTSCNATRSESIPATGEHSFNEGEITLEATCVAEGKKNVSCTICGEAKEEVIPPTGVHTPDEGNITKEPTCAEKGVKEYTCTLCGEKQTEAIAKTEDHAWDKGTVTKEATCAENGSTVYTCTLCGKTEEKTVNATGKHSYGKATVTKEATEDAEGEKTYTCSVCDKVKTESIPKVSKYLAEGRIEYTSLYWTLDKNGLLTISGKGAMPIFKIEMVDDWGGQSLGRDGVFNGNTQGSTYVNTVPWKNYTEQIKEVVIEEGCTEIGTYAFANCVNLEKITIPKSVEKIGNKPQMATSFVFVNCHKLKEVTAEGAIAIGWYAFSHCHALEYVNFPSMTVLYEAAFYDCNNIKEMHLGSSVKIACYGAVKDSTVEKVFFYGNAPKIQSVLVRDPIFSGNPQIYYAEGTTGWTSNWQGYTLTPFKP